MTNNELSCSDRLQARHLHRRNHHNSQNLEQIRLGYVGFQLSRLQYAFQIKNGVETAVSTSKPEKENHLNSGTTKNTM
jgi:hypothetical protein